MAEEQQPNPSLEELEAKLVQAMADGDMDAVLALAPQMKQIKKAKADADWQAKSKERELLTAKLDKALTAAYEKLADELTACVGFDAIDVSFKLNPSAATKSTAITKAKIAKASGGGGGGTWERKDSRSSEALYEAHGDELIPDGKLAGKANGMTYRQAFDSNTDKNWRYAIRKLLVEL